MSTEPTVRPAAVPPEIPVEPVLHAPREIVELRRGNTRVLLDPETPHWVATDPRGASILLAFRGGARPDDVARRLADGEGLPLVTARLRVDAVAREALRCGFLAEAPPVPLPHLGRETLLPEGRLEEFWVHLNDACNLACRHCLVSSGPGGDPGLPGETIAAALREARKLGARTFCFTGGEPLLRPDFAELAAAALEDPRAELAVLTNGLLLREETIASWRGHLDLERVRFQVSLDGSSPEVNDPVRGRGSFERIVAGIRDALAAGLDVTVTTTVTGRNLPDVPRVTRLVGELGGRTHHLLWLHRRGRAAETDGAPSPAEVLGAVRAAAEAGREAGVTVDNVAAVRARVNHEPGTRRDLSSAAVTNLCLHRDGAVYPSASLVGIEELRLGTFGKRPLGDLLRASEVARRFRRASLVRKEACPSCPVRFLCGGGDVEHAWLWGGSLDAMDPWCELHRGMIEDALLDRAEERGRVGAGPESGWTDPRLLTFMGEGSHACGSGDGDEAGRLVVSSSECVLSFELDATRRIVREFYGNAADHPEEDLCCPVRPRPTDIEHIPPEVVERFYGCGSPVIQADPRPGETTLDLGSGAGIDVFICARRVGPGGRALGVDMTDRMLAVAGEARKKVAANLGYDNVEFRKGFLEDLPVEDASVDLVTSNCVINLSPDKRRVFREIWRVLRNGGRFVVSDIVAEREVPAAKRQDPRLWGQCISGALTEEEFLAALERAGFHGIEVLEKFFWREVDGYRFFSVTVRGWRHDRGEVSEGGKETAVYLGPHRAVVDDQGIFFPRGVPVPVDAATADRLRRPPYAGRFQVGEVAPKPGRGDCGCRNC